MAFAGTARLGGSGEFLTVASGGAIVAGRPAARFGVAS